MRYTYLIENQSTSIALFELNYAHKNEEPAVWDFCEKIRIQRDLQSEDIIRNLYAKLKGRYDHKSSPIILLKLLLANDHYFRIQNGNRLYKDYFDVIYQATNSKQTIIIGNYYYTSVNGPIAQFLLFANLLDQLCGFPGMCKHICNQSIASGLSLVAIHGGKSEVLINTAESGNIIDGDATIIEFLLN